MEVSELTGHAWSEPTVKLYTRGITVRDPVPKQKAIELLADLAARGMTLEQVQQAILMKRDLEAKELSIDDVSRFLNEIRKANADLKGILTMYGQLISSGIGVQQLSPLLSYRSKLEAIGITPSGLGSIYETSKQYGGYEKVLQAITGYGDLESLRNQVASLQNGKVALESEVKKLTDKVSELTTKRTGMEQTIGMVNRLEQRGFDEKALDELERSSKKYGAPKAVLEAINQHAELTELQQKISDLSRKKSDLQSEIKKLEADNTQLMTVIAMSRTLLFDYNFSPSAISDIYELAKKYGQPFEVLKAIGSYGGLEAIETETGILSAERDELKNKLTELDVRVKGVKNTWDLIQVSIVDALNSLSTQVTDLPKAMARSFQEGIEAIQTKTLETGKAWGEVEQKIKASKRIEIILDLIERPTELKTEFNRVNNLSLAFVKGLQTYVELNKDRIRDSYKLEEKIRGLSEVLTERATSGA